uniref:hypothetical protein n=1 Tax=Roseimaritima sediminicola TaxID=2662066 RepID=UPI001F362CCE
PHPELLMTAIATVGALVRVSPWDDLQYVAGPDTPQEFLADRTSFVMRVAGWLEDGHIRYGVFGPVLDGPDRYLDLTCSLIVRVDGCDWRSDTSSSAKFKVGSSVVVRKHEYDFRHPDGTILVGYPRISCLGEIVTVEGMG